MLIQDLKDTCSAVYAHGGVKQFILRTPGRKSAHSQIIREIDSSSNISVEKKCGAKVVIFIVNANWSERIKLRRRGVRILGKYDGSRKAYICCYNLA